MVARQILAVKLALLLAVPAWTNPAVVGATIGSQQARIGGAELTAGTTIFSGDVIEVGAKGLASLNLSGGGQVDLGAESRARLTRAAERVVLELGRGAAVFRSTGTAPLEARIANASIRAMGPEPAVGVLAWKSPTEGVIAARSGKLLIHTTHDARSVVLNPGEAIEFSYAPAQEDESDLSRKGVVVLGLIIVGIAALTAAILSAQSRDLNESDRCDVVSPFQPCP
ncbi:MAG: hypothetical protein K6U09_11445 [Acidobacteriia bacterium]|jgi:hypothetical protein|nr:hypothetical protein [Terriglobia bacterium]